ncbi:hypothetical protein AHiyo8_39330 [Arthrobacter sp. Hiyo8]|nr:hypothetical protein AHiyo8_39330 [Arthrobacter sp. Hiyo8]
MKVTNIGGVPIYDVQLQVPEDLGNQIQLHDNEVVAKLPVGKSFTVRGWTTNRTFGGGAPNQFELRATGRLDDGEPFEQDVYFDAAR